MLQWMSSMDISPPWVYASGRHKYPEDVVPRAPADSLRKADFSRYVKIAPKSLSLVSSACASGDL